jgi:RNA polymerase sigma-70 factor (family 1)
MPSNANILPNERELFLRMAEGDEAAFADIFFHYIPVLQPHIFSLTRSEEVTQDIIHDVFLKLWMGRSKLPEVENYRAYLFTASTNRTYDHLRKQAKERQVMAVVRDRFSQAEDTTEEAIDYNQSAVLIDQAVAKLPPQRKLIFTLSREEGLSHDEIAERLHISKYTVSNQLTEALKFIKEQLQQMPGATGPALLSIALAAGLFNEATNTFS